jgi:hypothetical protein
VKHRLPLGAAAVRLVVVCCFLALVFGLSYLSFRSNANAALLLIASAVCGGLALLRVLVALLQGVDGAASSNSGIWGYEHETVVIGLALVSLFTPWRIDIAMAGAGAVAGWRSPLPWIAVLALVPSLSRRLSHREGAGLAICGMCLAGWLGWAAWLLFTPGFSRLHFPFQPLDLIGIGWYLALAGWVVAVDGAAARRGWERSGQGSLAAVLPWAVVPGAGLVRLAHPTLGRVYLAAAALMVFLLRLTAYTPADFAYNATNHGLPHAVPRTDAVGLTAILGVLWLASIVHTVRVARPAERPRPLPPLAGPAPRV